MTIASRPELSSVKVTEVTFGSQPHDIRFRSSLDKKRAVHTVDIGIRSRPHPRANFACCILVRERDFVGSGKCCQRSQTVNEPTEHDGSRRTQADVQSPMTLEVEED